MEKDLNYVFAATTKSGLYQVVAHPYRAGVWFAYGFRSQVAISTDDGHHWKPLKPFPYRTGDRRCLFLGGAGYIVEDLLVSPFDKKTIFVIANFDCVYGAFSRRLLVSTDEGASWNFEYRNDDILRFHFDPFYPERAFALTSDGIKALTKRGWQKISSVDLDLLVSIPGQPNRMLGGRYIYGESRRMKILESKDVGRTWQGTSIEFQRFFTYLQALENSSLELLAGTDGGGIYRYSNRNWKASNTGIKSSDTRFVAQSKDFLYTNPGGEFASLIGYFFYRSSTSGHQWSDLSKQLPTTGFLTALAANPHDPRNIILSDSKSTYVSQNSGESWKKIFRAISFVRFDPVEPDTIYFISEGLYTSTGKGQNPVVVPARGSENNFTKVWIDENNNNVIYFFGKSKLYKSKDRGETATMIQNLPQSGSLKTVDLAPLPGRDSYLLLASANVYRTIDGGQNWQKISRISRALGNDERLLAADLEGKHFFVMAGSRLFESFDGGKIWVDITGEIKEFNVMRFWDMTDARKKDPVLATDRGLFIK